MTRAEYVALLTEAKRSAIVDRWTPLANGTSETDVPKCYFCTIRDLFPEVKHRECANCPIHDRRINCCKEWGRWSRATFGSPKEHAAALAMLARIEAVDVEAWADHLVEKGVLRDE